MNTSLLKYSSAVLIFTTCLYGGTVLSQDTNVAAQAEAELRQFLEYQKENNLQIIDPDALGEIGEDYSGDDDEVVEGAPDVDTSEAEDVQADLDRVLQDALIEEYNETHDADQPEEDLAQDVIDAAENQSGFVEHSDITEEQQALPEQPSFDVDQAKDAIAQSLNENDVQVDEIVDGQPAVQEPSPETLTPMLEENAVSSDRIIQVSEQQLRQIRAENILLQSEIQDVQKSLVASEQQAPNLSAVQIQAQKELLQDQIESLYEKLARQKVVMEQSGQALDSVDMLQAENNALREQNERYLSYREDNALLRHELELSSKKVESLALQVSQLDEDRDALTQAISEVDIESTHQLKTEHALLAHENDQLAQRLAVAKKAGQMLYDQLDRAKKEIASLNAGLSMTNRDLETTQKALDRALVAEAQAKSTAMKSLNAENSLPLQAPDVNASSVLPAPTKESGFMAHDVARATVADSQIERIDPTTFENSGPVEKQALNAMSPFVPSYSMQSLLMSAGFEVDDSFTFVEQASSMTSATYEWMDDGVYGSASQQVFQQGEYDDFDGRVRSYLSRLESRCQGDFAVMPMLDAVTIEGARIDQYDVACMQADVQVSAAVAFFEKGNTFSFVSYEAPEARMDVAMDYREKTLKAVQDL